MIVRPLPTFTRLFMVTQGSIVPQVLPIILALMLLSLLVVVCDRWLIALPHVSLAPMSVFGIALSLFLGFRNNAAYNRWWEARQLWGQLVADCRHFSRETRLFINDDGIRRELLHLTAVYVHFHRGTLRGVDTIEQASHWLSREELVALQQHSSPACAVLNVINERIQQAYKNGRINDFGARTLSQRLAAMTLAQAGNERILSTPLPFVYSLLVQRTAYLYCLLLPFALIDVATWFAPLFSGVVAYIFFGLSAVTDELEHPFSRHPNALPLDALCRTIEIAIAEALGEPPLPKLKPINYLLT